MRYVEARIETESREDTYRIYSAEMLRACAKSLGYDPMSYLDILRPPKEETRTPEEIISNIGARLNALGGD